jgi:dimethyladenosine transferase 1, mitochondrial
MATHLKKVRLPPMPSLSDLVKLHKLRAIRQLSQNYLLDMNINTKIVKAADILEDG